MTTETPTLAEQPPLARPDYRLADSLWARSGSVFLTGTQALVRLMLMQRQRDAAAGLDTRGFISGYRGSPLGMVDQAVWKAGRHFEEAGVRFLPAINEELGATAVLGTQRVEADPERTCAGVFALWYGKGPGVDRAGDALKHGNAYGASPHGGVLMVAGDDHGCVSSSMPHQSDQAFQSWHAPIVSPASVAEYLEFGLYGWQLSRFSGNWVGFTALSEVVESASTVDLDLVNARVATWQDGDTVRQATGYAPPAGGLHYRWPDLPSLTIEQRLHAKLDAVRAFARINSIDRQVVASEHATVGIVTAGKAHFDFLEVLRRLDISTEALAQHGVRILKLGLTYPIEPTRLRTFAHGLREMLVIEEKGPVVEEQLRSLFYNDARRPVIVGKTDAQGRPLVPALGELRPSRLIELVANWLADHFADLDRRHLVRDFTLPELLSNSSDSVKRLPYFCAGCPHNISTKVPEGSHAQAGIGCHFMASWMDRDTEGLIQMGGEGVDWVSHAMFTKVPHVFQNLGDGTYYHSGYLAIRQAVAAGATLTYKILFNDAVAMTGGQPVDGVISVDGIARQVEAEGVKQVVVVSDAIGKYAAIRQRFPAGTTFHDRDELDAVQRHLRELPGVTVLIYEQTCAAEKRRRRKKGELVDPARRLFINERVCEGCGDCSVQSNCVAVLPHETPLGRKRKIDQSSCNKDYSCAKGFCPSFVGVLGGKVRKGVGALSTAEDAGGARADFLRRVDALAHPRPHAWTGPYDLLVTGVGGTGVVTVGALVTMAAHLEGKSASVLDFMGFAQKGGSVLSFVRLADRPERLNQVRIDTQQADAILACDLVVGASADALATVRHGRTRILANTHEVPVADNVRNPDASLQVPQLLEKLRFAAGADRLETLDAQGLAETFLGDSIVSNILALGYAWQRGLVPVGAPAMLRAIELNGVGVDNNKLAFSLGRLAAADPGAVAALLREPPAPAPADTLEALVHRGVQHLTAYQDATYARRYADFVARVRVREAALAADPSLPFTRTVARSLLKLMACKDEYEVARLYTDGEFLHALRQQFEGDPELEFYMAPPVLSRPRDGRPPRKVRLGGWMLHAMKLLAHGRALRGTPFDVFGYTQERRLERALVADYRHRIEALLPALAPGKLALATEIAALPLSMRGFGHVKQANVDLARVREAELLHRFDPATYPRPAGPLQAGQIKGIRVSAA
ncbi:MULTISPECIES: indolepyruvate ferredoxin oxidoreductase family protein [Ramlibacter]|uniref:Indolepyruvate ferredoxin oxidoreductase family protein n=1 Tax=Ramlibacter pinisoli TaxID=2682844 RepID=A0A6N8IYE6_9BURK|nr:MULTISPECIES: indolepyruvate ferredoxin oxidoreductase family protein [Ramlibacter]MBA2962096.1 indolepyruvate ferredoxin oxidoreductase family protein [Ramlibacter sp. CGMCC 1.13660]MVQ32039.1 indolepyruvate ferredoxin oxidoreductase family protein [Ramlibacter pinisoli]